MSNSDIQQIYDETTARIEAAYQGFRAMYSTMNPMPALPQSRKFRPSVKQIGMGTGLAGSVIVSASHVVPVFLGIESISQLNLLSIEFFIGLATFAMIEMGVISFAYSATEDEGNADAAHRVRQYTRNGMWFIVLIAVLANVYYVLNFNHAIPSDGFVSDIWQWVRITIFLLIGASAPVIAFITGDILAIDVLKHRAMQRKEMQAYQEEMRQWNEGLNNSWNAQKSRWGASVKIEVSKPEVKQLETVANSSKQLDYSQSLSQKAAIQYIKDNQSEYETIAKTVINSNPKATQKDIAEAIAEAMTGDRRGYMTVIRAYKKLDYEMISQ